MHGQHLANPGQARPERAGARVALRHVMRIILGCMLVMSAAGCFDFDDNNGDGYHGSDGGNGGGGGGGGGNGGSNPDPDPDCPGSDQCSPLTPHGLVFHGAVPINMAVPNGFDNDIHNHISAGGTDDIDIHVVSQNATVVDFDHPFVATASPPLHVTGLDGVTVHLTETVGLGPLDISDPHTGLLFDRYHYASSQFARAMIIPAEEAVIQADYTNPSGPFAFWAGDLDVGVALLNALIPPNRLVDTSAALVATGATQSGWDTLHFAAIAVGTYDVTVASGGYEQTAHFRVVDQVDDIIAIPTFFNIECFAARSQGAFIAHVPWTFTVDGQAPSDSDGFSLGPNCVFASSGQVIVASAGAKTLTVAAALQ